MKRIFLSALMVSIIGFATAAAQTITPFQKGDRVAIVGNSITTVIILKLLLTNG